MLRRFTAGLVLLLATIPAQRAFGAPSNDLIENAITIEALPFTTTTSTADATADPLLEPYSWCGFSGATVWFRYLVPQSGPLAFHTRGSDFDTVLNVFRRLPSGGLQEVNCSDREFRQGQDPLETSWTAFKARAGDELLVQVGGASDSFGITGRGETGTLVLTVESNTDTTLPYRPPLNDDRSRAARIEHLPFGDGVLLNSASGEPATAEESGCLATDTPGNPRNYECRTVWYRYDADHDADLVGRGHAYFGAPDMGVFRETGSGLERIASSDAGNDNDFGGEWDYDVSHVIFPVAAGDRIWIQLGNTHKDNDPEVTFSLREDPAVDFDVQGIRVELGDEPADPMLFIAEVEMSERSAFVYEFVACPVGGPPQSCFQFWFDRDEPAWHENTHTTVERSWYAAGCIGDFDITARVWYPYSVDPDPTNNSATTRVSIITSPTGAGAGVCPFL